MGLTNINEVVNHRYNLDPDHQPIIFMRHSSSKCTTKLSLVALAFRLCLRKKKNVDMHVVAGHLAEQSILPINSDSLHALYKQHNTYPFCKWCTFCPFLKISETTTHSELLFYPLKECWENFLSCFVSSTSLQAHVYTYAFYCKGYLCTEQSLFGKPC